MDIQESEAENEDERDLCPIIHLEFQDQRNRQSCEENISDDVHHLKIS